MRSFLFYTLRVTLLGRQTLDCNQRMEMWKMPRALRNRCDELQENRSHARSSDDKKMLKCILQK